MKLSSQAANNADDDLGDVTDESPVPGIYNPQMDGKARRRNITSCREWLTIILDPRNQPFWDHFASCHTIIRDNSMTHDPIPY